METNETIGHHVAWADRIGLNKQWARDIEACSEAYGTDSYHHMVRRFKNNIPNIKGDGPKLHDMIVDYERQLFKKDYTDLLSGWIENNPQESENESFILQKEDEIRMHLNEELYRFIIQLLEHYGFGFYKSQLGEMEEKMI